jgi:hypothetical protein
MNSQLKNVGTMVGICVVCIAASSLVRGGDLNPPPGPIQPTMHTLEDVMAAINANNQCGCRWTYKHIPSGTDSPMLIASGKGVVHGIIVHPGGAGNPWLYDAATTGVTQDDLIGQFRNSANYEAHSLFIPLDVEFKDGLVFGTDGGASGSQTVIYRLD